MKKFKVLRFVLTMAVAMTLVFGIAPTAFGKNNTPELENQVAANTAAIADNADDIGFLNNLLGQDCDQGEYVTGIDPDGFIVCAPPPHPNVLAGLQRVNSGLTLTDYTIQVQALCPEGKIAFIGGGSCSTQATLTSFVSEPVYDWVTGPPYDRPIGWYQRCEASSVAGISASANAICVDDPFANNP